MSSPVCSVDPTPQINLDITDICTLTLMHNKVTCWARNRIVAAASERHRDSKRLVDHHLFLVTFLVRAEDSLQIIYEEHTLIMPKHNA